MVPLAGGRLLFVQPLYGWRTGRRDRARRGRDDAIPSSPPHTRSPMRWARAAAPVDATSPIAANDFRTAAEQLYARMSDAMRRGDWVAFGHAYDALGALLNRARK